LNPPAIGHSPASFDHTTAMIKDLILRIHTGTNMIGNDRELLFGHGNEFQIGLLRNAAKVPAVSREEIVIRLQ
jgi:hypothetical protein